MLRCKKIKTPPSWPTGRGWGLGSKSHMTRVNKASCMHAAAENPGMMEPFAKLEGTHFEYYMTKRRVVIGRSRRPGDVDINVKNERFSRYISRKHVEIVRTWNAFYVLCRGKNGIYVNRRHQRGNSRRVLLPNS